MFKLCILCALCVLNMEREFGIRNGFYLTPRLYEPLPFIKRGELSMFRLMTAVRGNLTLPF